MFKGRVSFGGQVKVLAVEEAVALSTIICELQRTAALIVFNLRAKN